MLGRRPPILLIVRNPYARLVSLFNDKFRRGAHLYDQETGRWSHFHRMVFPYFGLPANPALEKGREHLLQVEFPEVMELLPRIYRLDGHLVPQSDILPRIPGMRQEWWLRLVWLAKMEDLDPAMLQQQWKIDVGVRANSTGGSEDYYRSYFTSRLYAIANEIYARDFELFGYLREE